MIASRVKQVRGICGASSLAHTYTEWSNELWIINHMKVIFYIAFKYDKRERRAGKKKKKKKNIDKQMWDEPHLFRSRDRKLFIIEIEMTTLLINTCTANRSTAKKNGGRTKKMEKKDFCIWNEMIACSFLFVRNAHSCYIVFVCWQWHRDPFAIEYTIRMCRCLPAIIEWKKNKNRNEMICNKRDFANTIASIRFSHSHIWFEAFESTPALWTFTLCVWAYQFEAELESKISSMQI